MDKPPRIKWPSQRVLNSVVKTHQLELYPHGAKSIYVILHPNHYPTFPTWEQVFQCLDESLETPDSRKVRAFLTAARLLGVPMK